MQKNSTSIIFRRTIQVVTFALLTHLFARLFWHLQVFGLNTVPVNCQIGEDEYPYLSGAWAREFCEEGRGTDFFQYIALSDTWVILGTHLMGFIVVAVLFLTIEWIFFSPKEDYEFVACGDKDCTCATHHHSQQYVDGEWEFADCMNQNCSCPEHKNQTFEATLGKWVDKK